MIAATHMLAGAALAARGDSRPRAVAIGALAHLLLDAVPHRDYRRRSWGGLALPADLAAGAVLSWALSGGSSQALFGAAGGVLPDVLRVAEGTADVNLTSWAHDLAHSDSRPSPWCSTAIQGLTAGAAASALWAAAGRARRSALQARRPGNPSVIPPPESTLSMRTSHFREGLRLRLWSSRKANVDRAGRHHRPSDWRQTI
jgi:hypothetical protein